MAVSKRVRYEILKRDDYTCRYCGASAPNVELHVDHVMPVALGGDNKPTNLVTACTDCNLGKTSTKPSDGLVADISNTAIALEVAYQQVVERRTEQMSASRKVISDLIEYWNEIEFYKDPPVDAKATIRRFLKLGMTQEDIEEAFDIAQGNLDVTHGAKWNYACGVLHNKVKSIREEAETLVRVEMSGDKQRCGHCSYCLYPEDYPGHDCLMYANPDEDDVPACEYCDDPHCLYGLGHSVGEDFGSQCTYTLFHEAIWHYKTCPEVNHG